MRAESPIDRRIFVVGVPRSGTTLVQSLLAAHSSMTSFTESHFFSRHFTLLPWLSRPLLTRNPSPRLHEFLAENNEQPADAAAWFTAKGQRSRVFLPLLTRPAARNFLRLLDQLTRRRGRSIWIEKTPKHLRYIPLIEKVSDGEPRTSFVHVIREGLEVVASLHRASRKWERSYDLESCVKRWNADVGFSLGRVATSTDHFIFYEELTSQPEQTLRRLLAGLDLSWEPDILERYARTSDQLITGQEAWKADVGRGIRRSGTSDQALTAEQRDWVRRSLRQDLYGQLLERARPLVDCQAWKTR